MNTLPLLDLKITSKSASVDAEKRKGKELEAPSPKRTLTSEEEDWIQKVNINPYSLEIAPFHIKNSKVVVLAAVQTTGSALAFASEELKKDKDVMFASATAKKFHNDTLFLKMLASIWESMQAYMIDEERFSFMDKDEKAAYCAELDKFQRRYSALRQTADKRGMDEHSKKIEETLEAMESSLAVLENNPCLKWEFENEFVRK